VCSAINRAISFGLIVLGISFAVVLLRVCSSRAASSRHAVDAVVVGNPVPIGIPALFLADQLSRGRTAEQILSGKRGLIVEYAGAEGYAYRWGHLIEVGLGRFVLWRIVRVALWERLSDVRAGSPLLIEDLLTLVQPGIRPALDPHLPSGVVARGCQGANLDGRCRRPTDFDQKPALQGLKWLPNSRRSWAMK
jgi:hypothetical protein